MKSKIDKIIFNEKPQISIWLVILGLPMAYLLWNLAKYNGPAILTDEIGYLANAVFLAGYHIDGASSYHAGFSLFLPSLFLLFSDTSTIWKGSMVINSLFWVLTFYLTHKLIANWDATISPNRRALALLLASLYPTWATMSGYVFTNSAFTSLFMAGLLFFIKTMKNNGSGLCFFTVCVGFLYWIHPTGLVISGASIIAIGIWTLRDRKILGMWFSHTIGCIFLFVLYKYALHSFILSSMTPEGYAPLTHYPSVFDILNKIKDVFFGASLAVHVLGQASYLLVGSLGVALWGGCSLIQHIEVGSKKTHDMWRGIAGIYIIGALLGVILSGAINFSILDPELQRSDHWIYGRYLDNVSLPVLIVGILALMKTDWREDFVLISLGFLILILTGCIIYVVHRNCPPVVYSEIVNIPAFWPQYFFPSVRNVGVWLLLGALIIPLLYMSRIIGFCLSIPIIFTIGIICQTRYHKNALENRSAPTAIVDIIKENYPPGSCVSFDLDSSEGRPPIFRGRISLYKYYLYDYCYRRVSKEGWGRDCSDLILTYDPSKYTDIGIEIARESRYGLSLVESCFNNFGKNADLWDCITRRWEEMINNHMSFCLKVLT